MHPSSRSQEPDGKPYCYDYPRPAVTVDLAVLALAGDELRVLLIKRKHDPFAGSWALPGGFLEMEESIEAGARRELKEETGYEATGSVAFLGAYGAPGRDPRGRTISMAHATVIRGLSQVAGGDDAAEAAWRLAKDGGHLAFDHDSILQRAVEWVQEGVRKGNLGLELLPEEFDEAEVKAMFRALFDSPGGYNHWLRRMEKTQQIEPRTGSGKLYHAVQSAATI